MTELLSPAGSYEGFLAALKAGADAIYAGGELFGARAYAKNFTEEELLKAIDVCLLRGKKLYLTVNTLCKERELDALYDYLKPFYEQGLHGVIVQDLGVVRFIRECFPLLHVHASTQMAITGARGALFAKSLGMTRVVPARELTLDEIKKIRSEVDIELECFIHGAMCYSYSGQCLFSSFLGGRSGNRGRCAQPCRLDYSLLYGNSTISASDKPCLLSMRDMCTIEILPQLIEAGISSFKIEGRMKKPEYTWFVTGMYRKYMDLYYSGAHFEVKKEDLTELSGNYIRTQLSKGYYFVRNSRELITLEKGGYNEHDLVLPDTEPEPVRISGRAVLSPGKEAVLTLTGGTPDSVSVTVKGEVCQMPKNSPLTAERVRDQLNKSGGTGFVFDELTVEFYGDVFMPMGAVNALRRAAISALNDKILEAFRRTSVPAGKDLRGKGGPAADVSGDSIPVKAPVAVAPGGSVPVKTPAFRVLVNTSGQLKTALKYDDHIDRYYVEASLVIEDLRTFRELAAEHEGKLFCALPFIMRECDADKVKTVLQQATDSGAAGVLIRNPEELRLCEEEQLTCREGFSIVSDHGLYSFNSLSCSLLLSRGVNELTVPLELNVHEMKERGFMDRSELIYYGSAPMMISAGCLLKTQGSCRKGRNDRTPVRLKDRYKNEMPVITECEFCHNIIYNSHPTFLGSEKEAVGRLSPGALRLQFTFEDDDTCERVLDYVLNREGELSGMYTKGHFRKGVL